MSKRNILFLVANILGGTFFIYFILRLNSIIKKSIFVRDFSCLSDGDYVIYILILCCVILLATFLSFWLPKMKKIKIGI